LHSGASSSTSLRRQGELHGEAELQLSVVRIKQRLMICWPSSAVPHLGLAGLLTPPDGHPSDTRLDRSSLAPPITEETQLTCQ
ncbi:hypothetical protein ATANTOWER_008155, partial [Ataeniobius toweri]|nr:hypothetical protein [Ataeniobius toweri]